MNYQSLSKFGEASFIEKKSEFIGNARPITSEEEAIDFINEIRKKHPDARHIASAYLNVSGSLVRFSDDGEPQGTAGMPILEVLKREEIVGAVVTVTRYFGGILLGAGGLTRAYGRAAKLAIDASGKSLFIPHTLFNIEVDYSMYNKLLYEFSTYKVTVENTSFETNVLLRLAIPEEVFSNFSSHLTDISNGKIKPENLITEYRSIK